MDPDLSIVLLGKAGGGKSASGNTILGKSAFESKLSFTPVTKEITQKSGRVFGKQICVIDTPGILDKENTEGDLRTFCQDLLQSGRPVLFLVVIKIDRFTKDDQEAVEAAMRVLGPEGLKKSYILFTRGDLLKNMSLNDFIFSQDGPLTDVVMKIGAYHVFNNEDTDQEQVRNLLLKTGYLSAALPEPISQKDRRIVLLGQPGAGKSSSGNTILGSDMFRSDCDFDSVSEETRSESSEVDGRQVTVVDTPGFTEEALDVEHLYMEIMKTLVTASPGPHAFVIVVRIGRISKPDQRLFKILPKLFGEDASKFTMVLFTGGDGLGGRSLDETIRANKSMSDLVSMCGGRYYVFDNTKRGDRKQVRKLLNKIDEMVTENIENVGEYCSNDLFRMVEKLIREEANLASQSPEHVKKLVWKRIRPYVKFGLIAGLVGGPIGVAVGVVVGVVVGGPVGAAVGAVVGGLVGRLVGWGMTHK